MLKSLIVFFYFMSFENSFRDENMTTYLGKPILIRYGYLGLLVEQACQYGPALAFVTVRSDQGMYSAFAFVVHSKAVTSEDKVKIIYAKCLMCYLRNSLLSILRLSKRE